MSHFLSDRDLDLIFRSARSHNVWTDKPVTDVTLAALYDLLRMGPTSANSSPARFLFLRSQAAKERIAPHLSEGNRAKSMSAPVIAVVAYDTRFFDKLPQLFPHNPDAPNWFNSSARHAETTAFRNGTLQGAYLIVAARALGLDCGPMSGFDNAGVDAEFFPDGQVKSNFLCNLGYGDHARLMPRNPRLSFDEACQIL